MIKIDIVGKVLNGFDIDKYIKIVDDGENSDGFLVFISEEKSMTNCFDDWVENMEMLKKYFEESGWMIEWSD